MNNVVFLCIVNSYEPFYYLHEEMQQGSTEPFYYSLVEDCCNDDADYTGYDVILPPHGRYAVRS